MTDPTPVPPELTAVMTLAVQAVGPITADTSITEWNDKVNEVALNLHFMMDAHGPVASKIAMLSACQTYRAVLVDVVETARKKAAIHLYTHSAGRWQIETNLLTPFLNSPEGIAVYEQAKQHIGREVLIYKVNEKYVDSKDGEQKTSKECRYVRDLGPADESRLAEIKAARTTGRNPGQDGEAGELVEEVTTPAGPTPAPTAGDATSEPVDVDVARYAVWGHINREWPKEHRTKYFREIMGAHLTKNEHGRVTNLSELIALADAAPAPRD